MKKERKEHKKGQETNIGKIIYGFLLFMPLIAIGSSLLISTFNMSTKQQAEINYAYKTKDVESNNDIETGYMYNFDANKFFTTASEDDYFYITNSHTKVIINSNTPNTNNLEYFTTRKLEIYHLGDRITITNYINPSSNSNTMAILPSPSATINTSNTKILIGFDSDYIITKNTPQPLSNYLYKSNENDLPITSVETHNVNAQDIFYNSIDKVTESPLFTWAGNSIVYTTLNSTCNALSITTPFIPLIFAYWLIISVIYFLYDIALMLVWLIHDKIHCLQESI